MKKLRLFLFALLLIFIEGAWSASHVACYAEDKVIIPPSTSGSSGNYLEPSASDRPNRAVDRFSISLRDAFEVASKRHPDLIIAKKNLDMAKARIVTAGARPNPQIASQLGWGPAYTGVIAGNTQQIGVNQLFEVGGKRGARLKYAKELYELALRQITDLKFDVRSQVRRAYAEAAAAEALVDLIESNEDLMERFVDIARERTNANVAAPGEALQAQLALDQYHTDENKAFADLRRACIKLDYLLGMPLERDIDVDNNGLFKLAAEKTELVPGPSVPLPSLETLVASAFEHRPDLQVAQQQAVADRLALSLTRRQAIPDVLLGSGFAYSTYQPTNFGKVPQQYGAYLNANVDVPIFYRKQGEIAAAKTTLELSTKAIDVTRVQVRRDVYLAYESLVAARHNIRLFQAKLLGDAKKVAENAQKRYESFHSDIGDVMVGQRAYLDTMKAYFDTVVDYQNAWADLETAIGAPVHI